MTKNIEKTEPKKKLTLEEQRLKDREPKRGIFKYHEVPGGVLRFPFKKYKQDPVEQFELFDGQIYTLPLGVAKHLNENCWYPDYSFVQGDPSMKTGSSYIDGNNMQVVNKIRRTSFSSLEFMGDDDMTQSNVLQVTYAPGYDARAGK